MYRCKTVIKLFLISLICVQLEAFQDINSKETFLILKGFQEKKDDPKRAIHTFKNLYDMTKKSEYLKEAAQLAYMYKDSELGKIMNVEDEELLKDDLYSRIKIAYLIENRKFQEAISIAKNNLDNDKNAKNYSVLAIAQEQINLNEDALKNYKKAYELDADESNLLSMVELYVNRLGKKEIAIKELESYRKLKGCTINVCSALIDLYKQDNKYKKILAIYEDLYKITKRVGFLEDIVNFYLYNKDYNNAVEILKKYKFNDKLLIEIYGSLEKYDLAIKQADESYKNSKDLEYLAMKAVYLYEKYSQDKKDSILKDSLESFEKSVLNLDDAMYQNYYGYILIDLDIDIKKGMDFIDKALKKEPKSAFYLDSLAWGYYKLKDCKKANEIMKKIDDKEFFKNDDGRMHLQAIEKCLNDK